MWTCGHVLVFKSFVKHLQDISLLCLCHDFSMQFVQALLHTLKMQVKICGIKLKEYKCHK